MNAAQPAPRREDQPDGSVRIIFAAPILFHDEARTSALLRQPTAGELWDMGDPITWVFDGEGRGTSIVERELLRSWIGKLVVDHDADMLARDRDLSLGMLIEEVVLGFFRNARMRLRSKSAA